MAQRTYSREEVQAILSRALEGTAARGDDLSHEDLVAVGRELGIEASAIEAAAAGIGDDVAIEKAVEARVRRSRRGFVNHLFSYVVVNAALLAMNLFAGGPFWFVWPLIGWGIGMAFHARAALFPDREHLAVKARKRLEQDRAREEKQRKREERWGGRGRGGKADTSRIEQAAMDVVAETLGAVADAIGDSRKSRGPSRVRVDADPPRRVRFDREEAAEREAAAEEAAEERDPKRQRR
ncbi:MAG: 2TM domain-containing protein [Polyangiaceae bacterium]